MKYFAALLIIIVFYSCKKDKIVINDQTVVHGLKPSFALPIAHTTLNLGHIESNFDDDDFIYSEEDEVLALTYQKELFSYALGDLLDIPIQNNTSTLQFDATNASVINALSVGTEIEFPMTTSFDFGFSNGEELDEINISTGSLNLSIQSEVKQNLTIEITFPTVRLNNLPLVINEVINYGGSVPINIADIINLDNYQITFNSDGTTIPLSIITTVTKTNEVVNAGESILISSEFQINTIESVFGYFGQYTNIISSETQNLNLFPNLENGSIYFANPKIKFIISNSSGIDLNLNINNIQLLSNGVLTNLSGPDVTSFPTILGAVVPGDSSITTHTLSNAGVDPSLSSMFTINSSEINYTTTASTNPGGYTSNFLLDSSKVSCIAEVLIPLYLRAENIQFNDTIELDLSNVFNQEENSQLDSDDIEQITLRVLIENGFPLDIKAQIYFANENFVILDSLWNTNTNDLFVSGLVDFASPATNLNYGRVISPSSSTTDFVISKERFDNLTSSNSKKIIIKTIGHTTNANENELVKFYPEYELGVKISAKVDFDIDLN